MKKIFTLCCILAATYANAQTLTKFTTEENENGYQVMDISNNGKYIGGVTLLGEMFIIDVEKKEAKLKETLDPNGGAEIRGVSNNGIGVGFNEIIATLSAGGEFKVVEEKSEDSYGLGEDISDDGTIIAGAMVNNNYGDGWLKKPCIWINGVRKMLPEPTTEEIGFNYNGASTKHISADGSVILGHLMDDVSLEPAALWIKDGDTYRLDSIWKGRFHPTQYDEELGDFRKYDEPYVNFRWGGLSANGKYAVLTISENLGEEENEYGWVVQINTEDRIGIYDIENKELKIITIDGNHGIDAGTSVTPTAVSNDGTVVGYTTGQWFDPRNAIILKAGENQPRLLKDVYGSLEALAEYDDNGFHTVTGITGDGRYITGFGSVLSEKEIDGEIIPTAIVVSYVLDTKGNITDGISNITNNTKKNAEYFTVDGRKISAPVKGLNIIKTSNGETRKFFVK